MKVTPHRIFPLVFALFTGVVGCATELAIDKHQNHPPYPPQINSQDMSLIPAGEFLMGSTAQNVALAKSLYRQETGREPLNIWFEDEAPAHRVYLDAYFIDQCEVTNGQYKAFIEATGYKRPFNWMDAYFCQSDKPVMGIEWEDAQAYATWAGKRLPTEAQWEKAARGGLTNKLFPWGDEAPQASQEKYDYVPGKEKFSTGDWEYHLPVRTSEPNGYGIYEMTSNVYEWCYDWYSPEYYKHSPARNPTGPKDGAVKVVRGGSWFQGSFDLRCAYRNIAQPYYRSYYIGFRCVRTVPGVEMQPAENPMMTSGLRVQPLWDSFLGTTSLDKSWENQRWRFKITRPLALTPR